MNEEQIYYDYLRSLPLLEPDDDFIEGTERWPSVLDVSLYRRFLNFIELLKRKWRRRRMSYVEYHGSIRYDGGPQYYREAC